MQGRDKLLTRFMGTLASVIFAASYLFPRPNRLDVQLLAILTALFAIEYMLSAIYEAIRKDAAAPLRDAAQIDRDIELQKQLDAASRAYEKCRRKEKA